MRLHVLALDYDGTIAVDGAMDREVRAALRDARAAGLVLLLATGRIRGDLERHLADPGLFDGIVAENGAVLHFPAAVRSVRLGAPPTRVFTDELRQREIPFLAGECVVEIDATHAPDTLEVIRDLELPLTIAFNRDRAMVLPQATSKGTGLREALRALRRSPHNTLAVGDAENDHELLLAAAVGVAVAWGSPALQEVADRVLPGAGPTDVAPFLREMTRHRRLCPTQAPRRRVHLGVRRGGEPLTLPVRDRTVLVTGDTRSGKSWVAGLVCEQLVLQHFCVCVIDPEGEYAALESLPSVVVFDAGPRPPDLEDIERALRYPDVSVIVDLSLLPTDDKCVFARVLLARLQELRRATGLPHRVVVDEAHYFLHDEDVAATLDLDEGGFLLVSYRPSLIAPALLDSAEIVITTRLSDADEVAALEGRFGSGAEPSWRERLAGLGIGEAVLLRGPGEFREPGEAGEPVVPFSVSRRLTAHVRHREKYRSVPVPADRAFVFRRGGDGKARTVRTLEDFVAALDGEPPFAEHLAAHDFSRWLRGVFADRMLAARVEKIERQWAVDPGCRPHERIAAAVRRRYPTNRVHSSRSAVDP